MRVDLTFNDKTITGSVSHDDETFLPLKELDGTEFYKAVTAHSNFQGGILPPAVRWISSDKSIVVFERPPMSQLVEYIPLKREQINEKNLQVPSVKRGIRSHELNIPWTTYVIAFDKTYLPVIIKCFVRNSFLTDMKDPVYLMPLLNFYNNSQLCNPRYGVFEGMPNNLGEGINMAYNLIWNSGWNFDLHDAVTMAIGANKPFFGTQKVHPTMTGVIENFLSNWSKQTRQEILETDWCPPSSHMRGSAEDMTLEGVIEYTKVEFAQQGGQSAREFMVNIVSSLV